MSGLEVRDLCVGRSEHVLLSAVSFAVAPGAALSLHGPNGLGKTTLLRTLAGLTPPLGGALTHDPETVAYSAHADGVKASLSVGEMLWFWTRVYGGGDVEAALAAFGIAALVDRPGAFLSAGQRRRVALARLHLSGRPIWLLDEPVAGLDAAGQAQLAAVLDAHLARGGMAVMVTHGVPPIPCTELDLTAFAGGSVQRAASGFEEAVE